MGEPEDGDRIRFVETCSGLLDGAYAVIAGSWQGSPRAKLERPDPFGREAVLLTPDDKVEVVAPAAARAPLRLPLCCSCGGSGKIEWTDEDGWQHEAPCGTCDGQGETG
ncbi:hypothetical protein [Streptomyces sp. URMC 123]|uniref:hypothetical protein n=1 Tax=Streptomyces sp. URMC 123 TaxID=3423403 RepID=UPI003F1A0CBD